MPNCAAIPCFKTVKPSPPTEEVVHRHAVAQSRDRWDGRSATSGRPSHGRHTAWRLPCIVEALRHLQNPGLLRIEPLLLERILDLHSRQRQRDQPGSGTAGWRIHRRRSPYHPDFSDVGADTARLVNAITAPAIASALVGRPNLGVADGYRQAALAGLLGRCDNASVTDPPGGWQLGAASLS